MPLRTARKRVIKAPEERRQDILDAAVRVFAEKGIRATTVADITEAALVAKGTFYLYFESKEHLLGALRERFVDETLEKAAGLYERVGREDWWALVDATVETMIDFMLERRDAIHVFTQEGLTPHTQEIFAECEAKLNRMFADGIRAGIEADVFRVRDPAVTASLLHHAIEGAVLEAILYGKPDRDALVGSSTELAHKTLAT